MKRIKGGEKVVKTRAGRLCRAESRLATTQMDIFYLKAKKTKIMGIAKQVNVYVVRILDRATASRTDRLFLKCDIPVVFYKFICIVHNWQSKHNQFIVLYVQCIKTTCFGLFWPYSGFSYSLESEVSYGQIYHIDDEISFTFYKLLLWRDY